MVGHPHPHKSFSPGLLKGNRGKRSGRIGPILKGIPPFSVGGPVGLNLEYDLNERKDKGYPRNSQTHMKPIILWTLVQVL